MNAYITACQRTFLMMPENTRIKTLSLQLANQIAAGEVVERPASVVKELLENALDAHSSQIDIDIERGGSALIRIIDDGDGINKEDLALAVSRHATSKLNTLNELEQIISLGFRGEALASISAVSRLLLKSKQADQEQGWMINTGTETDFANYRAEPEPVAQAKGTSIEVRDLFFNTPARRKFMRTVKTEFKHIDDIVKRIALSRFDIAFKLNHNKKLLRHLPKASTDKTIQQRIAKLFSADFLDHAHKVDFSSSHFSDMGDIRIWGWISAPQWHRKQSDWQYFYVNGRYIKDKLVNHALRQAYQELLPEDTFCAYLLYLEIDPQQVDVNVHPTKHEVRFRQTRLVHDFIYSALKSALCPETQDLALEQEDGISDSAIRANKEDYVNPYRQHRLSSYAPQSKVNPSQYQVKEQIKGLTKLYDKNTFDMPIAPEHALESNIASQLEQNSMVTKDKPFSLGSSLGPLIPNYLISHIVEQNTSGQTQQLLLIHIVRAQQFLLRQLFKTEQALALLIPETITLECGQIELLLQHHAALHRLGFEMDQLGENTLMVRKSPSLQQIPGCKLDSHKFIKRILPTLKNDSLSEQTLFDVLIQAIYSASMNITEQEMLLKCLSEQVSIIGLDKVNALKPAIWKFLDESSFDALLN